MAPAFLKFWYDCLIKSKGCYVGVPWYVGECVYQIGRNRFGRAFRNSHKKRFPRFHMIYVIAKQDLNSQIMFSIIFAECPSSCLFKGQFW